MAKSIQIEDIIIWEDDDFLVINKPPYVSTLDDRNDDVNILKMSRELYQDTQVCHRLDKETSGALAIAKNPEAYRHLSMQFESRKVQKVYHAITDGIHDFDDLQVDLRILKLSNGTVRIDRKGKESITAFNTIKTYTKHTLIDCRPVTGRMHQIRIHLSQKKAPISGDIRYGGRPFYLSEVKRKFKAKKDQKERPLIGRLALHAFRLSFETLNDELISIQAPYPKDFEVLMKQLEKNN